MGECTTTLGFDDNMVCHSSALHNRFDAGVSNCMDSRACALCHGS